MKQLRRITACLLAAVILMCLFTGCGGKDEPQGTEQETESSQPAESETQKAEEKKENYKPEDLSAAGSFATSSDAPDESKTPEESTEPETSSAPEETEPENKHTGEYGGIPMENVLSFIEYFTGLDDDEIGKTVGKTKTGDMKTEAKTLREKTDKEICLWLDSYFIGPDEDDYDNYSKSEIDNARNMVIVLASGTTKYVPDKVKLETFLGENGLKVFERWQKNLNDKKGPEETESSQNPSEAKPEESSSNETDESSQESSSPAETTAPASGVSAGVYSTQGNEAALKCTIHTSGGFENPNAPGIYILKFKDDGTVEEYRGDNAISGIDNGAYTYDIVFSNQKNLKGHVYYYIPANGDNSINCMELTTSQCTLLY